jgi:hypothetical protein
VARARKPRTTQRSAAKQALAEQHDPQSLAAFVARYLEWLKVHNYSPLTVESRELYLGYFVAWCTERGLRQPREITRPVLERYQRSLYHHRKRNGEPMSFHGQRIRLMPLRAWFKWLARQNYLLYNPASELELPKIPAPARYAGDRFRSHHSGGDYDQSEVAKVFVEQQGQCIGGSALRLSGYFRRCRCAGACPTVPTPSRQNASRDVGVSVCGLFDHDADLPAPGGEVRDTRAAIGRLPHSRISARLRSFAEARLTGGPRICKVCRSHRIHDKRVRVDLAQRLFVPGGLEESFRKRASTGASTVLTAKVNECSRALYIVLFDHE